MPIHHRVILAGEAAVLKRCCTYDIYKLDTKFAFLDLSQRVADTWMSSMQKMLP